MRRLSGEGSNTHNSVVNIRQLDGVVAYFNDSGAGFIEDLVLESSLTRQQIVFDESSNILARVEMKINVSRLMGGVSFRQKKRRKVASNVKKRCQRLCFDLKKEKDLYDALVVARTVHEAAVKKSESWYDDVGIPNQTKNLDSQERSPLMLLPFDIVESHVLPYLKATEIESQITLARLSERVCKLMRKYYIPAVQRLWQNTTQLVFATDATASMSGEINSVKRNVASVLGLLRDHQQEIDENAKVEVSALVWRDFKSNPAVDLSAEKRLEFYKNEEYYFTEEYDAIGKFYSSVRAVGGDDEAEDVAIALEYLNSLPFLCNPKWGRKLVILYLDALTHGLGTCLSDDNFPEYPEVKPEHVKFIDWLQEVAKLRMKGVELHPVVSCCTAKEDLVDFVCNLARRTGGSALHVPNLSLLVDHMKSLLFEGSQIQQNIENLIISGEILPGTEKEIQEQVAVILGNEPEKILPKNEVNAHILTSKNGDLYKTRKASEYRAVVGTSNLYSSNGVSFVGGSRSLPLARSFSVGSSTEGSVLITEGASVDVLERAPSFPLFAPEINEGSYSSSLASSGLERTASLSNSSLDCAVSSFFGRHLTAPAHLPTRHALPFSATLSTVPDFVEQDSNEKSLASPRK